MSSLREKLPCANCGGSGRVSAESELFAGVMGTTGCRACEGRGWNYSPLHQVGRWLRALEVRLEHIIESESGEMKKHFEARRGVYSGIADDLERLHNLLPHDDKDKDRLFELYAMVEQYMAKPPSAEKLAKLKAMREEREKTIDPATAWSNIQKGLEPQVDPDYVARVHTHWDKWDAEKDIHQKALLQLELGAMVSGLMEHIEALEKQIPEPNPYRDGEGRPWE